MKIGVYNYHAGKNQSKEMFGNPKLGIGDDLMKPFQVLRDEFRNAGHELCSVADYPMDDLDAVLFIEWPTLPWIMNSYFQDARKLGKKMFLLLMESEVIRPSSYRKSHHQYFEKVFTWKDDLVDGKKYIKYCWPQNIPKNPEYLDQANKKLVTLISSHKLHSHKFELYSERIHAIRFFEAYEPEDFDLYGGGWGSISFRSDFMKYAPLIPGFSRLRNVLQDLFFHPFPSWKGRVDSKKDTLSQYEFAICYENAKNIPGYITEKIFDCFFAGCIPIYLGPPNIDSFIPRDTYIDKNIFPTYQGLYAYLKNMPKSEKEQYKQNMKRFLLSDMGQKFSSEAFSKILIQHIIA